LLVSTQHRTFVCSVGEQRTVTQVGRQQRKTCVTLQHQLLTYYTLHIKLPPRFQSSPWTT